MLEKKIGTIIAKHRAAQGITQKDLAARIGISASNYSSFESGRWMNLQTLFSVMQELGLSVEITKNKLPTIEDDIEDQISNPKRESGMKRELLNDAIIIASKHCTFYKDKSKICAAGSVEDKMAFEGIKATRAIFDELIKLTN